MHVYFSRVGVGLAQSFVCEDVRARVNQWGVEQDFGYQRWFHPLSEVGSDFRRRPGCCRRGGNSPVLKHRSQFLGQCSQLCQKGFGFAEWGKVGP